LLLLRLLSLRLRRTFLFWLWLRLSPWCRRRSRWRRDTFAARLLLSHRFSGALRLWCTWALDALLLCALLLLRSRLLLWSRLLNAFCFTLFLSTASWLSRSLLLLLRSRRSGCGRLLRHLLLWRASSVTLVTHLELLSLRTIRCVVHAHMLRKVGPERR
jgi:hypothetical protein